MDCNGMWDSSGVFLLSMFGLYVGNDSAWSSNLYLALGGKKGRYGSRINTDSLMVSAVPQEFYNV